MNISENSRPITIKFYLKHQLGGGKAALGFGPDWIRTLISMATDSSHRVIMGEKRCCQFLSTFFYRILFIPVGTSSIGSVIVYMTSQNGGKDGRHGSKMAAMAPIQDGVQAQIRVINSDDPVTRSLSPRRVS